MWDSNPLYALLQETIYTQGESQYTHRVGIYTRWVYTQGASTGNNIHTGWVAYTQGGYTHMALLQETMYTQGGSQYTHRMVYTQGRYTHRVGLHTGWVYTQGGNTHRALRQETMYTQGGFTHRVGMHTGDIHAGSSYRKQCTHRAGGRRKDAAAFT